MARAPRQASPAPIVIPASQDWDGNDGPWSSFTIQVGSPPQVEKVLISTAATQTWVVVPQGCTTSDPSNCGISRGSLFLNNASTTWRPNTASLKGSIYVLGLENWLGYTGNGLYGFDDITLGWPGSGGPTLNNQTVAGIATKDFYMGVFGLRPASSNFSSWDDPIPSYLQNLKNQSLIPSTSWSYTAGNQYRLNSVLGSLVLGGYDASKFVPNNVSFPFNEADIRELTVHIDGIKWEESTGSPSLLPTPILAYIDSTVPHIWLPAEACTLFEDAFGLTYDTKTELYLVNDTQHRNLLSQNPSITFQLGNLTAGTNVNINFPYAAFDLSVSYPIVANSTRYFPLRRAANTTQYTLGRTFLQEAYVTADYERHTFSVSQCSWDGAAKANIIPIHAPNSTNGSNSPSNTPTPSPNTFSFSAGATASIVIGIVAILVVIFIIIIFYDRRRRRPVQKALAAAAETSDNGFLKPELDTQDSRLYEADGGGPLALFGVGGKAICEAPGDGQQLALEIENSERSLYEMPAREEVAIELDRRDSIQDEHQFSVTKAH